MPQTHALPLHLRLLRFRPLYVPKQAQTCSPDLLKTTFPDLREKSREDMQSLPHFLKSGANLRPESTKSAPLRKPLPGPPKTLYLGLKFAPGVCAFWKNAQTWDLEALKAPKRALVAFLRSRGLLAKVLARAFLVQVPALFCTSEEIPLGTVHPSAF